MIYQKEIKKTSPFIIASKNKISRNKLMYPFIKTYHIIH